MRIHDEWLLTPHRVALHEPTATAVVADVHLGYAQARRQGGDAVPLVDLNDSLYPLDRALAFTEANRLVIAGDLFEKAFCPMLWQQLLDWLLQRNVVMAGWVPGNHDRGLDPDTLPLHPDGLLLGDWLVLHGHRPQKSARTVIGHWHPACSFRGQWCPCYLAGPGSLVLPAFSADAAGSPVSTQWQGFRTLPICGGKVLDARPLASPTTPSTAKKRSRPWTGRLRPG